MKDIKKDKCKIERHMTETHALPLETFAIYIYIYIYWFGLHSKEYFEKQ